MKVSDDESFWRGGVPKRKWILGIGGGLKCVPESAKIQLWVYSWFRKRDSVGSAVGTKGEEVDEEAMAKEAEALFDDAVKDRAQQMVEDFMVEQMVEEEAVKTAEATIAVLSDPAKLEKISSLIEQAEEEPEVEQTDAVAAFQAWLARS